MKGIVCVMALVCGSPVAAQEVLPALYSVTGVAANDVLNVRAAPDAAAAALSGLPPDAAGIEVVARSPDGKWAQINAADQAGWVARRFLVREPGPDWTALQSPLTCFGTEPFWSLHLDMAAGAAMFEDPDYGPSRPFRIDWATMIAGGPPMAGVHLTDAGAPAFATIAAETCSDGMSDRVMGLAIRLFQTSETGHTGVSGCCRIAP